LLVVVSDQEQTTYRTVETLLDVVVAILQGLVRYKVTSIVRVVLYVVGISDITGPIYSLKASG
jgi:hypothetical protein